MLKNVIHKEFLPSIIIQIIYQSMKEVYLLIPLLTSSNPQLEPDIEKILNITSQQYELYQFDEQKYAVQLRSLNLGYQQLTRILEEHTQIKQKMSILQNNLKNYQWGYKEISIQANSIDSLMKKAIKYKQLKQQNKKLKKLLQNQLQNTQKVREQTQKTMKVLRQQFDNLVRQMNKQVPDRYNQRGGQSSRGYDKPQRIDTKPITF